MPDLRPAPQSPASEEKVRVRAPDRGEETGTAKLARIAQDAGIRQVDVVAWRDLDDPEAGGSELHAHEVMRRWAEAGISVRSWTSRVDGAAREISRHGYVVSRRAGRYAVFPRTALAGLRRQIGCGDGLVEIWNGMPFFSPLWARCPRVVFLHHVHAEMWHMVLSRWAAKLGYAIEHRVAPPIYRSTRIVTLSESAKAELVERLGFAASQISVVPPGIDQRFKEAGSRLAKDADPLVIAVGRLVPVKRFDWFIEAMTTLRRRHPRLRAVIVGEGYERPALEAHVERAGARSWLTLPGRLTEDALIDLYQRAWLVVSTSLREGWGMTLTEAAACGTPAVATRIAGHLDAVVDGETGILVNTVEELVDAADAVIRDPMLRRRLSIHASRQAEQFSWDRTAIGTLTALATARRSRARSLP